MFDRPVLVIAQQTRVCTRERRRLKSGLERRLKPSRSVSHLQPSRVGDIGVIHSRKVQRISQNCIWIVTPVRAQNESVPELPTRHVCSPEPCIVYSLHGSQAFTVGHDGHTKCSPAGPRRFSRHAIARSSSWVYFYLIALSSWHLSLSDLR
jgi:hypothetical protein